ncbi:transcriptional regulator [Streptomyces sp. WAC 06725]|uniref:ScbA/BarX family gamma-butyrolactone biosynthesis protein n=1 Tax=Streptomyces sp. WAC 06725 TaxID=2203209 RepID=UPI000F737422|nr:ScbA/BarX family gamma-butyrolactone biosynthesis protein [Streptomyces sp. WAC 06725]RSO22022.1 transcriptional regulator [Streptomyces sp. WAC 06725]
MSTTGQLPKFSAPAAAGPSPRTLTTTVPKEYVHKTALSEVLLTSWQETAPDVHTVTAEWPRAHTFYSSRNRLHDPLLLIETIRQTIPLLSHLAYNVPFGHQLIWDHFTYSLDPDVLRTETAPTEIELRIACSDIKRRKDTLSALTMDVEATRNGVRLGTAVARFTSHAPAVYRRLRGEYGDAREAMARAVPLPPPVAPHRVARAQFESVMLSPTDTRNRWQLRTDTTHPVIFDHPVDHAPGMLLLEAAHQAVHAALHPMEVIPVGLSTVFTRYAELDAPCWIEATVLGRPEAGAGKMTKSGSEAGAEAVAEAAVEAATGSVIGAADSGVEVPAGDTPQTDGSGLIATRVTAYQNGEELFSARVTARSLASVSGGDS